MIKIIDNSSNIQPSPITKNSYIKINNIEYILGNEWIDENLRIIIYELNDTGSNIKFDFLVKNGYGSYASIHLTEENIVVFFESRWDIENDVDVPEWQLHFLRLDINDFSLLEIKNISNSLYKLLPLEGPFKINCVSMVIDNKIKIGFVFNANKNTLEEPDYEDIVYGFVDKDDFFVERLYKINKGILSLYITKDYESNKVFVTSNSDENILYEVYPSVKPIEISLELEEGRIITNIKKILGYNLNLGFKKDYNVKFSIHNTYFKEIDLEAKNWCFKKINSDIIEILYQDNDAIKNFWFDLKKLKFGPIGTLLMGVESFYVVNKETNYEEEVSKVLANIGRFVLLEYQFILENPELKSPKNGTIYTNDVLEFFFWPKKEKANNPIMFKLNLTFEDKEIILDSSNPNTEEWFYEYNNMWNNVPTSGLASDYQNCLIKVKINKEILEN